MIATVTADALLEFFVRQVFDQLRKNGTAIVHPGILAAPAPVSGSNRSRSSYQSTFVVAIRCGYVAKISRDSNDGLYFPCLAASCQRASQTLQVRQPPIMPRRACRRRGGCHS